MKKTMKLLIIIILVLLAGLFAYKKFFARNQIMDGDGMIYSWVNYDLNDTYCEQDSDKKLVVRKEYVECNTDSATSVKIGFSLPEGAPKEGVPNGEVFMTLDDNEYFDTMSYINIECSCGSHYPKITLTDKDGVQHIFIRDTDAEHLEHK